MADSSLLPTPEQFLLEVSLYSPVAFNTVTDYRERLAIEDYLGPFDAYCVECNRMSTFRDPDWKRKLDNGVVLGSPFRRSSHVYSNNIFTLSFVCQRNNDHVFYVFVRNEVIERFDGVVDSVIGRLTKIGQYPSLADILSSNVKKYQKPLGKDHARELSTAVGLYAHGVGTGSYVYLRRIFESLIEKAHCTAKAGASWDEVMYNKARMAERIGLVNDHLPKALTDNPKMYSILSIGIHELSEDQCKNFFPVLLMGIELILDEEIERQERNKKLAELSKSISAISLELKSQ